MAKRSPLPTPKRSAVNGTAGKQTERPSIIHSSLYLPEPVYEALRKIAFDERLKIHDVVLEGIDSAVPCITDLLKPSFRSLACTFTM